LEFGYDLDLILRGLEEAAMAVMRIPMRWWLVATMAFAGCGSSGTAADAGSSPGSGADPGSGTKTLYAGTEVGLSGLAGAGDAIAQLSVVLARGMRGGPSVSGASVVFTTPAGVSVTATEVASMPGFYMASGFGWEPSWHVQISAGSDQLQFTVAAPGATMITSPVQDATVAAGPLALQWTDAWGAHAQSVWADCCGVPIVSLTDSGTGTIAVAAPGGEVTLYRQNAFVPSGGAAGSLVTALSSYGVYLQAQ
jgi:hypothetical protein